MIVFSIGLLCYSTDKKEKHCEKLSINNSGLNNCESAFKQLNFRKLSTEYFCSMISFTKMKNQE